MKLNRYRQFSGNIFRQDSFTAACCGQGPDFIHVLDRNDQLLVNSSPPGDVRGNHVPQDTAYNNNGSETKRNQVWKVTDTDAVNHGIT
jgi:hypothetical protein